MASINVFGFVPPNRCPLVIPKDEKSGLPKDTLTNQKLDFDPKTGSTKVNSEDKVDLYSLIQTYKDQCGVEYIMGLVAKGMANPDKFADDGKHGGDASLAIDANDMYRDSLKADGSLSVLAKELGIELTDKTTDQEIAAAIVARITPKTEKIEGGDK